MAMGDFFGINVESLFFFIVLILITLTIARMAYSLVRHVLETKIGKRRSKKYSRGVQYLIIAAGLSYGMTNILQIDLATVAATLGLAGIVIALASQQILQNLMAGVLIGLERQIQLEDWIDIGGSPDTKPSRVKDITLTKTILLDPQGKLVVVPNSYIVGGKIINYTKAGFFEVPLRLTLSLEEDFERVKKIIIEVADKDPFVLPNVPEEERKEIVRVMHLRRLRLLFEDKISFELFKPRVLIADISDAKVTLSIRIWIREINRRDDVVSDFLTALYARLREEKIRLV